MTTPADQREVQRREDGKAAIRKAKEVLEKVKREGRRQK